MFWPKSAMLAFSWLFFGAALAFAEPGFQPVSSAQVPPVLRAAAVKVLQVWTPTGFSVQPRDRYASILTALERVTASDLRAQLTYLMMREDVRRCQARSAPNCLVTNRVMQGSAFVLEDGTLIAARHDFSQVGVGLAVKFSMRAEEWARDSRVATEQVRVAAELEAFQREPLSDTMFILTNASHQVVFNSAVQGFRILRFGALMNPRGMVDLETKTAGLAEQDARVESASFTGAEWIDRDSVRIQLSVSLPALIKAQRTCAPGARAAIVGYPGTSTKTRATLGARDAVRDELSVSQGQTLTLEQVARRARDWAEFPLYAAEVRGRPMLLTDADGTSGVSGGPILNEQGEVCGMFKAFFPGDEKPLFNSQTRTLEMFSFGVSLEYF